MTNAQLLTYDTVVNLCIRTGFKLNSERRTVLAQWIVEGENDVQLLADAIVHY